MIKIKRNPKQMLKYITNNFEIVNNKGEVIHKFKCKSSIKEIYDHVLKKLLEIDPKNKFDYSAFHCHFKTIMNDNPTKRRYSVRGYSLRVENQEPILQRRKAGIEKYKFKKPIYKFFDDNEFFVYKIQPIGSEKIAEYIGSLKGHCHRDIYRKFNDLIGYEIKSDGLFNNYLKKCITFEPNGEITHFKNYMITPFKIDEEQLLTCN